MCFISNLIASFKSCSISDNCWPGIANIKSILMFSIPSIFRLEIALITSLLVCALLRNFNLSSLKVCTPIDTLLIPYFTKIWPCFSVYDSGFISIVNSFVLIGFRASKTWIKLSSLMKFGVPPPIKTVSILSK